MGVWESVQAAVEGVRRRLPDPRPAQDLGSAAAASISAGAPPVGELIGAAAEKARAGVPDLGAACRRLRDLGWGAATWVDQFVRVEAARQIQKAMSDREGWERIGRITRAITDKAIAEGTKPYTGGIPVYKYIRDGLAKEGGARAPAENHNREEELRALRKRVESLEASMAARSVTVEAPEVASSGGGGRRSLAEEAPQKPEDVLKEFMAKVFMGGGFTKSSSKP